MQQDLTIVEAVNRTTRPLNFLFDGAPGVVLPGYKEVNGKIIPAGRDGQPQTTALTKTAAEYARRQNVQLGSEDPVSGEAVFLVGVAERDPQTGTLTANPHWLFNEIDYVPPTDAIERLDRSMMDEVAQSASKMRASGFPRGRQGTGLAPFQYNDGPSDTSRQ